jgi:hypothetical protein
MKERLPLAPTVKQTDNPMNVGVPAERVNSFPWQGSRNADGTLD